MRRAYAETEHEKWANIIRRDAGKYSQYETALLAFAAAVAEDRHGEARKLLRAIPDKVQDAVIPQAVLYHLAHAARKDSPMFASLRKRTAKVHRVLARHVAATATATVDVIVTLPDTEGSDGDRHYSVDVPVTGTYSQFMDALLAKLTEAAGGHEVTLADFTESGDKTPLRAFLDAAAPPNHEATKLFYDWIESNYYWDAPRHIKALSTHADGFANTPYTWDYYESHDDLVGAYGYVFQTTEGFPEDDDIEGQYDYIIAELENDGNNTVEKNQLVSGDTLIIRPA